MRSSLRAVFVLFIASTLVTACGAALARHPLRGNEVRPVHQ